MPQLRLPLAKSLAPLVLGLSLSSTALGQIDVEHVVSIGRNALYFHDYVVAIGYFNRAVDTRPWMSDPYLYRSIAKVSLEDYRGAIADASAAIERNPYVSRSYYVRGIAYQNLGQRQEAIADYKAGLALAPDHAGMHHNLIATLLIDKQYDEAEMATEAMRTYAPRERSVWALRAGIALERGDTTLATSRIDEAIARDSTMALPYRLRAAIAADRGDWQFGLSSISRAIELATGDVPELYAGRGIMHYKMNNLRGAMQDYTTALGIDPKNKLCLHNRALLRQFVGERREALQDWETLLRLEPENDIARFNRARLSIELGLRLRDALGDLDKILAEYPSFQEGFLLRSELRKRLGDRAEAERDYWHAWDMSQSNAYQSRARQQALDNQERRTRHMQDQAIDKYNLLVEASATGVGRVAKYSSQARGRVQDRQVQLSPQPMYYLSYFTPLGEDGKPQGGRILSSTLTSWYNATSGAPLKLGVQTDAVQLESTQIDQLSREQGLQLDGMPIHYLRRGIAHSLLQDYRQAIQDYDRAVALDSRLSLAYFARAVASTRLREAEDSRSAGSADADEQIRLTSEGSASGQLTSGSLPLRTLELVPSGIADLSRSIELTPDFAPAYYNRAYLYALEGERQRAIEDYTRAIERSPRMAQAYFNRGLLLIATGSHEAGVADLSQAGELGVYQAYSLIKQMNQ